jgi:anti-sigma B factor antagonist
MLTKPGVTAEAKGQVLVGTVDQDVFIQVAGRGTHLNSQPLRECLLEMVGRGYRHFNLDLADCTYMDSTFLGVLANVCLQVKSRLGTFAIPRINQRNLELFQTLGIDRFFQFTPEGAVDPACNFRSLPEDKRPKNEWGTTVLEAHRTLMDADPRNCPRFKDVVDFLEEDLRKTSATGIPDESSTRRER